MLPSFKKFDIVYTHDQQKLWCNSKGVNRKYIVFYQKLNTNCNCELNKKTNLLNEILLLSSKPCCSSVLRLFVAQWSWSWWRLEIKFWLSFFYLYKYKYVIDKNVRFYWINLTWDIGFYTYIYICMCSWPKI